MVFIIKGGDIDGIESLINKLNKLRETKDYEVDVRPVGKNRSTQQNRYYWGVVIKLLGDFLGYFPDEMHEVLKAKFLSKGDTLPNGEFITYAGSSKELDTIDFEDFVLKIRAWAATEFQVVIPEPNEVIEL